MKFMNPEIKQIKEDIKIIKENHIFHLSQDMAEVKTNVSWLIDGRKSDRTLLYTIIGGVVVSIIVGLIKLHG